MSSEIVKALQFLCDEKGLQYEVVLEALESALAAAYRKDFGSKTGNYTVKFDPETGDMQVWDIKTVVEDMTEEEVEAAQTELTARREQAREEGRELAEEEIADLHVFNPKLHIMLSEAKLIKADAEVGEVLEIEKEVPHDFGRMAAMTAKQVIIQKLREAERSVVFDDIKAQEGTLIQGTVQRRDRTGAVTIDLGKIMATLPQTEQSPREQYRPGLRMKFYILKAEMTQRGPEITLSRSSKKMVETVFAQEIPEIASGDVEIRAIARDPGNRSKVAVFTDDEAIDPIGACIGQKGSRITTIIEELGGEKIDVIQWKDNAVEFIKQALSPAKVDGVELDEENKEAKAFVAEDQFSLAIGRGGQNVRLAADLTGWKINVVQQDNEEVVVSSEDEVDKVEEVVNGSSKEEVGVAEESTEKEEERE